MHDFLDCHLQKSVAKPKKPDKTLGLPLTDLERLTMAQKGKWTSIQSNVGGDDGMSFCLRLTPKFVDLATSDFPDGLAVTGQTFSTLEEATKMSDRVDKFMDRMLSGILRQERAGTLDESIAFWGEIQESMWTSIYADFADRKMFHYIRFHGCFVDLKADGFPHGISISGQHFTFATRQDAQEMASRIDGFMNRVLDGIRKAYPARTNGHTPSVPVDAKTPFGVHQLLREILR